MAEADQPSGKSSEVTEESAEPTTPEITSSRMPFRLMVETAFKQRELERLIVVVPTVAAFMAILVLFPFAKSAFTGVNQAVKLLVMCMMCWGAARTVSPSPRQSIWRSNYHSEWTVVLLIAATLLTGMSFLLDAQDQRKSTQEAIDRQTDVIKGIKQVILPLNDALTIHLSFQVDSEQPPLKPLSDALRVRRYRDGKLTYGVIPITEVDTSNSLHYSLADFVRGLPLSFKICSSETCAVCGNVVDPKKADGTELLGELPLWTDFHDTNIIPASVGRLSINFLAAFDRYDIGVNASLKLRAIADNLTNSGELPNKIIVFQAPDRRFKYGLKAASLMRQDGRILRIDDSKIVERCGKEYYVAKLGHKWLP